MCHKPSFSGRPSYNRSRPNIKYPVKPVVLILELYNQLNDELTLKQTDTPNTILFCQSL